MNDLQDKTNNLDNGKNEGKTPEERIDALLQAFELFCQETSRLESAYSALKEEFCSVNLELEVSNDSLNRKVAELNHLTGYFESLVTHISQGLLFIDLNGYITTFNPAAETIFELTKEKVLGKPYADLFDDRLFGFSMQDALHTHEAPDFTRISHAPHAEKSEKLLDIETEFMLTPGADGLILTVRDITELKRLEILANRNDRMKELGLLAAEVAHEIRNPLGGIKGFASLLKRDLKGHPEQEKMAGYIIEGTDSLNELVTHVLDYARPVQPHFMRVKVSDLIAETKALIDLNSNLVPKPEFKIVIKPQELEASFDPIMLKAALLNMMVNSTQAMPSGGTLTVKAKIEKNELIIEICDTGIGIPKENVEKIFSPFFTTKTEGNGFGLAEVHKMVLAHGGQIEIDSKPGHGTVFKIKIPQKV